MIFLVITGVLFLILGGFYLSNSWMRYHEWKGGTIIVVLSLIAIVYGTINLPVFHHGENSQSSQSSERSSQTQTAANSNVSAQQQKEDYALRQLQKTYAKFGDVSFNSDTKTFTITPTTDNAKQAMNDVVQNPGNAEQDGWNSLAKSARQGSKQLVKLLGHGYKIKMVQPGSKHKEMLVVKDGHTIYNITADTNSSSDSSAQ